MPGWLKKVFVALGLLGGGLTIAPGHTVAHSVGQVLVGIAASVGVASSGLQKPKP